ncbi:carnosine synthase 1-like [Argopecten irradians]|uniref:carnosine synthase 1-like n=1 Tax=Argopecten irradians TaxID=31199 RepID=UPI00371EBB37
MKHNDKDGKKKRKTVILVSTEISPPGNVYKYIQYDFTNHQLDHTYASEIVQILTDLRLNIDGCCTFKDECAPLTAYICDKLQLAGGVGVKGAIIARGKNLINSFLRQETAGVPYYPRTFGYTGRSARVMCEETLKHAIGVVGLPAVCKPEHGAHADGVKLVRNEKECLNLIMKRTIGFSTGEPMMIMEYFDGTEHDIEVILYQGEVIAAVVSDNGPTRPGSFLETSMSMPSCLPSYKITQLQRAASDCCIEIGLRNGVFNVEMKMTTKGSKLLEINGRMGGNYIRDYMYSCYGFDLVWYVIIISVGIRPPVPELQPQGHVIGITCHWPVHKHLLCGAEFGNKIEELIKSKGIRFYGSKSIDNNESMTTIKTVCNVSVVKESLQDAKTALLHICDDLGIHTSLFDVPLYLSDFVIDE